MFQYRSKQTAAEPSPAHIKINLQCKSSEETNTFQVIDSLKLSGLEKSTTFVKNMHQQALKRTVARHKHRCTTQGILFNNPASSTFLFIEYAFM